MFRRAIRGNKIRRFLLPGWSRQQLLPPPLRTGPSVYRLGTAVTVCPVNFFFGLQPMVVVATVFPSTGFKKFVSAAGNALLAS